MLGLHFLILVYSVQPVLTLKAAKKVACIPSSLEHLIADVRNSKAPFPSIC